VTDSHTPGRLRRLARRGGQILAIALALVLVGAMALGIAGWVSIKRSLPLLDGTHTLAGLGAPATIERDAQGVPTLTGTTRLDVARATGFVHAQDRFFQMDLLRRRAAGELAALVGPAAIPLDKSARLHRFRARAARVLAEASAGERATVEAYTAGVRAGLAALRARPPEYLALRAAPVPWRAEDSALALAAMFFDLQDSDATTDARRGVMAATLPAALVAFLESYGSDWDTPLMGEAIGPPAIPGPEVVDVRSRRKAAAAAARSGPGIQDLGSGPTSRSRRRPPRGALGTGFDLADVFRGWTANSDHVRGSNNWVVSGRHTETGAPLLASDMHLGHALPNIWYRARLRWSDERRAHDLTGVTLPGLPGVVVGSNGRVAWGFTNTEGDWSDLVVVEPDARDDEAYLTPSGPRRFDHVTERIEVARGDDVVLDVRETIWGPVVGRDTHGRWRAVRWVAHEPPGMNLRLFGLETASSLAEAFTVVQGAGIPAQNCVVADAAGHVGWTIAGSIPRRIGFDGTTPVSWADGARRWDGWLSPREYPALVDPPNGRIVTANNRLVDGAALAAIGYGTFDQGARARQIRNALGTMTRATARDLLRVQLDDRALFLERWHRLAVDTLTVTTPTPTTKQVLELLKGSWTGHASIDSVAYRITRAFRTKVGELAFAPLIRPVRDVDPSFPATLGRAYEGPLWEMVSNRPPHLLDARYSSWDALLRDALDKVVVSLSEDGRDLSTRTWGESNTLRARHPLSRAVPPLARWLDAPAEPLPGDAHMPRVQAATFGASERLVVSPGREQEGLFHMPGGQSGHPLSPNYRDGTRAWARGEPTPFLPGPTVHTLRLVP
jgi:penicillin amidase